LLYAPSGSFYQCTIAFVDSDGVLDFDTLDIAGSTFPSWMSIEQVNGSNPLNPRRLTAFNSKLRSKTIKGGFVVYEWTLSGTPEHENIGDTVVSLRIADGFGQATVLSYSLHVTHPDKAPASFDLVSPPNLVGVVPEYRVPFVWHSSADPDSDDNVVYYLTVSGPGLDTTLGPLPDTSAIVPLAGLDTTYTWNVSASDGILLTLSNEIDTIRTTPYLFAVNNGWNMVSLPLSPRLSVVSAIFPTKISSAFTFSHVYQRTDSIRHGAGFWLDFRGDQSFGLAGTWKFSDTVRVVKGWNLVGMISLPLDDGAPYSIPDTIIQTPFYGFINGEYKFARKLQPGRGYWINVNDTGEIVFAGTPSNSPKTSPKRSASADLESVAKLNTLTFSGGVAGQSTLMFGNSEPGIRLERFSLPPLPPADAMDVRFASQRSVDLFFDRFKTELPISIQMPKGNPLSMAWKISEPDKQQYFLIERTGSETKKYRMSGSGSMAIDPSGRKQYSVGMAPVPTAYKLYQNYPNPFNPTTTITFDLPIQSDVSLKVYDILGKLVRTIYDHAQVDAGTVQTTFDATGLASGIYFYRISAGKFTESKKVLLLK
ncbi:MAG TPA: T9SS type A sorting domain-containing protein, partial [Bacteroidota bacterium]|nr:T9SS type A sorting domain-containing protein [Bacteroidota bacterium]